MEKTATPNVGIFLLLLTLLGTGCVSVESQTKTPEEAALSLSFSSGTELSLRETVLGLGGKFVTFFQQEASERSLVLDDWMGNERALLHWERNLQEETQVSKDARTEYYAKYAAAPIGSQLPDPPKQLFETIKQQGTLSTQSLQEGSTVFLPPFWRVDEEGGKDSTLIWLSKKQYDELVTTRRTDVNLGLFDDSVSYAVGLTDQVKFFVEKLKGSQTPVEQKSVLEINARIDWAHYTLSVNGVQTVVRAIQAQNAFARYTILANPENPLILEIMLSPASRGSLNLFSREAIGEAFWGYEISSVKTK